MRDRQWVLLWTAVILLAAWPAGKALGATVSGRAGTVLEWFDDAQENTAVPFYQYLLLNVKDIDGNGLNFRGYGRLAIDLQNEVNTDSRLYYAYLEKKDILANLDCKLGRQFISTTAGASVMDGLYLKYRNLGPLDVALYGGGDVTYYDKYDAGNMVVGGKLAGHFLDSLDLGLSYLQKWDDGDLTHELFGFDLDYNYDNILAVYNETQFSYLADSVTYFLAGAKYYRNPKWSLRTEYLYSLPVFSSTSIYSVFAVDKYEELMAEGVYRLGGGLRGFARYTREMYDETADANVLEAGLEKIRTNRISGYLSTIIRQDEDGQDLRGVKARAAYYFNKLLQAGVGVDLNVLERRIEDDDETTSKLYWADVTSQLTGRINVQAKLERVESDLWDHYYRGRIGLNINF